ncbi:MAG TPA: nucleotidyltransferase family protein [Burkholderiales bacterium]|nr:nucleotidyltransferase family protein [Burkholderiales bacterium]
MATGILLAAGSGTRFGGGKLLATLPGGMAVGIASYRNLRAALDRVCVVVRSEDGALIDLFEREGASMCLCTDAALGMSRSLITGIRANPDADGWIIALGDMPFVRSETVLRVARALRDGAAIAVPTWHGQRGHPAGFAAGLREELLAVTGDEGARSILRRHAAEIRLIECDDPGVMRDIDTPADLAAG